MLYKIIFSILVYNVFINYFYILQICENDLLPKRVCYHCASAVLVWNELYECSSDADQKLRNMFEHSPFDEDQCKVMSFSKLNNNFDNK